MPYLPMSFWQEFLAQMVAGPTPPYEMDNSLIMPCPSPKKTLIPELTIASAFSCRWACRKADTNSNWKKQLSGTCRNTEHHLRTRQAVCVECHLRTRQSVYVARRLCAGQYVCVECHIDIRCVAPSISKKSISAVEVTQCVVLCYGSPSK